MLHELVRENLETFLAQSRARTEHGFGVPRLLDEEFRAFIRCGVINHGMVVMRRAVSMRLRNAVHHGGHTASRDPRFAPIYARLRATGANHARAVRGVGDRLLGVLSAMLRNRTLYQPLATTTA